MKRISFTRTRDRDKTLHIEAPGCIVNVMIDLTNSAGQAVTRVEILADHYAGEPRWWIDGEDGKAFQAALVVQESEGKTNTASTGARCAAYVESLARVTLQNGDTEGAMALYESAARIHEAAGALNLGRAIREVGEVACSVVENKQ
jgi:hypothetical protein